MRTPIQNFAERYGKTLLKHSKCPVCGDQMYYWKHQEVISNHPRQLVRLVAMEN